MIYVNGTIYHFGVNTNNRLNGEKRFRGVLRRRGGGFPASTLPLGPLYTWVAKYKAERGTHCGTSLSAPTVTWAYNIDAYHNHDQGRISSYLLSLVSFKLSLNHEHPSNTTVIITYSTLERGQTRCNPLPSDQCRPVKLVSTVSSSRKHVLMSNIHDRHRHIVRFSQLSDMSKFVSLDLLY